MNEQDRPHARFPAQPAPPPAGDEDAPVLTPSEARQGLRGRHVFVILALSTILAAIALFLMWGRVAT
jgi:hypothetical protein